MARIDRIKALLQGMPFQPSLNRSSVFGKVGSGIRLIPKLIADVVEELRE